MAYVPKLTAWNENEQRECARTPPGRSDIPTLKNFGSTVVHSSQHEEGEAWKGKSALVIGAGNSGHDIAQDLHSAGSTTTLVQRGSTMVVQVELSAQLPSVEPDVDRSTDTWACRRAGAVARPGARSCCRRPGETFRTEERPHGDHRFPSPRL